MFTMQDICAIPNNIFRVEHFHGHAAEDITRSKAVVIQGLNLC